MPPVDGILETALYVVDPEQSARFYQTVFGFPVVTRVERLVALAVRPGQVLLLFKKGASAHMPQVPHDGGGQLHLAFAIPSGQLDSWREWLREKGVTTEHERHRALGGGSLYFTTPD